LLHNLDGLLYQKDAWEASSEYFDWKAGVHTPRLAAFQKETLVKKFKNIGYRGMAPASKINFLSKEDTSRLAARFFIILMIQPFGLLILNTLPRERDRPSGFKPVPWSLNLRKGITGM